MNTAVDHNSNHGATLRAILHRQIWHFLAFAGALLVARWYSNADESAFTSTSLGVPARIWFWIAIWVPIVHQIYVWLVWRIELYTRAFTSRFGEWTALRLYQGLFFILLVARLLTVVLLASSSRDTLGWSPVLRYGLFGLLLPPIVWTLYSVVRYFGLDRASGIDHFIEDYNEPFERRGIYRYMNNAMYVFGLAVLYLPGLLLASTPALIAGLISHALIWAHFFFTELPDMRVIFS